MGKKEEEESSYVPEPTPTPAPQPSAVPSETSALTAEKKRKKVASMRYGLSSTMKSGTGGVTGTGPDLMTQAATGSKKTLGG